MSRKLILEANSCPDITSSGKYIERHSLTIDTDLLKNLSEEEIKDALYKWFKPIDNPYTLKKVIDNELSNPIEGVKESVPLTVMKPISLGDNKWKVQLGTFIGVPVIIPANDEDAKLSVYYSFEPFKRALEEYNKRYCYAAGEIQKPVRADGIQRADYFARYCRIALDNCSHKVIDIKLEKNDDGFDIVTGVLTPSGASGEILQKLLEDKADLRFGLRAIQADHLLEDGTVKSDVIKIIAWDVIDDNRYLKN